MTDIAKRLEAFASVWPTAYDSDRQNIALLREAAAEIGRLRGEVAALLEDPDEAELAYRCGDPDSDAIAPAEAKGDACPRCRGTGETCTGTIDGIPELFDCRDCLGSGMFTAPVGATIADAASDPSLTLDAARQLLRDVAHAIESGRYNTPQPAGGAAVSFDAEAVAWAYRKLLNFGCYTSEAGAMMGDRLNLMLLADTTPPAPVQAAPQEGEALARKFHDTYERLAPSFGYETRQETRQFDPETPNGRLMIAVCAELAAHPSACELGADDVGEIISRDKRVWALAALAEKCGAVKDEGESGLFWTLTLGDFYKLEAALQHRGDSQEADHG